MYQQRQTMPWMTAVQIKRAKEDLISLECQIEVQYTRCRVRCEALNEFLTEKMPRRRGDLEVAHEAELKDYEVQLAGAKKDGAKTLYMLMQAYSAKSFEIGWGQDLADQHFNF